MTQHRQHSSPSRINLLSEKTRLETFYNWPMTATLEPERLARAGFFYIGPQDRVRCIFCGGVLKSWQPTDDPFTEHQQYFAQCPFIKGEDVGNIPIEASQTSVVANEQLRYHPFSPHYNTVQKRLKTFVEWPSRVTQRPEKMAEAGYFYCGVDDAVRCFFCDGGLRNWTASDDPWVEHARWFPRCPYLQEEKGSDFVASILQRFPQTQNERRQAYQWAQTPAQGVPAQRRRETMAMESEAVQEVLKMGFEPTRVHASVQQLMATTGGQLPSLAQLLDKLLQEDDVRSVQGPGERQEIEPVSHFTSGSETNILPSSEINLDPVSDRILCKICMDNQVEMTFLPCGHLICCVSCAHNAHTCPMCRRPVRASIRTYLC